MQDHLPRLLQKKRKEYQEKKKHEDLDTQSSQQDIIGRRRILIIWLGHSNQRRTTDLDTSRDNITRNKDPQDPLRTYQWRILPPSTFYQHGDDGVDCSAEEDRSGDDEEVLQDEPEHEVGWVRGLWAEYVTEDLEEEGDGDGDKVEGAVAVDLVDVDEEGEGEEDRGGYGKGVGWDVAVDDDGCALKIC